jgi:hypothetical protein
MMKRNRKLRRALRVLSKKAWSNLDKQYAARALKLLALALLLNGCCCLKDPLFQKPPIWQPSHQIEVNDGY